MQTSYLFHRNFGSCIAPIGLGKKSQVFTTLDLQNRNLYLIFEKSPSLFFALKLLLCLRSHREQKIWLLPMAGGPLAIFLKKAIELLSNNKGLFYEIVKEHLLIFDRKKMRRSMGTTQEMLIWAINPSSLCSDMQGSIMQIPHGAPTHSLLGGLFKKRTLHSLAEKALLYLISKFET